jgi:hypothetical protein
VFVIFECDSCNGAAQPSSYKAEVSFQFAKGELATAQSQRVSNAIGEVFAIDNASPAQQTLSGQGQKQNQPAPGFAPIEPPAAPAPDDAPPPTVNISLDQTPDQVKAALGQPDRIVKAGTKEIWSYKNLKVTFIDGKVSDVQ